MARGSPTPRSFNGATRIHAWRPVSGSGRPIRPTTLQWGHAHSRVETSSLVTSEGLTGDTLQWGHAHSRVETFLERAASVAVLTWLQWGQAHSRVETPRKNRLFPLLHRSLQWGHAHSRVETVDDQHGGVGVLSAASMGPRAFTRGDPTAPGSRPPTDAKASMGPRAFTRGDPYRIRFNLISIRRLQWGHAHSRVETKAVQVTVTGTNALQWGHAHSRVETRRGIKEYQVAPTYASMGPRAFTRGDSRHNTCDDCNYTKASMGPRAFTRGDLAS